MSIALDYLKRAMPATVLDLITRTGWSQSTVERHLRTLRAAGDTHVVGWYTPKTKHAKPQPIHGAGPGEDVQFQRATGAEKWARAKELHGVKALRQQDRARAKRRRVAAFNEMQQMNRDKIFAALDEPRSAADVIALTGLPGVTVHKWINSLLEADEIHLSDTIYGKGRPVKIYSRGAASTRPAPSYTNDPIMAGLFARRTVPTE